MNFQSYFGSSRMLAPFREQLDQMKIVLGSSSPRRREIFGKECKFEVIPSLFDESTINSSMFSDPSEFVRVQAQKKCEEIMTRVKDADIIITADTINYIDNQILGKPGTHEKAYEMLKMLNNRSHLVETGVYIAMPKKGKYSSFSCTTKIYFDDLPESVIRAYAYSDDPLDKSGGYGYSSKGTSLVKKIDGDFGNSVGFPLNEICKHIAQMLQ